MARVEHELVSQNCIKWPGQEMALFALFYELFGVCCKSWHP